MASETFALSVPRQEFTGWLMSVAAFKQAGVGEVDFIFQDGELLLQSDWGETRMPYEGGFNGRLMIKAQRLLTLAKRGVKLMPQPVPVKLTVDVNKNLLVVDFTEVPAHIAPASTQRTPATAPQTRPSCVGVTVPASMLGELIRKVFPAVPPQKEMLKITAGDGQITFQSTRGTASCGAFVVGAGEWSVPARTFRQVLDSFKGTPSVTLEADATGLKLNSFKMPVSHWNPPPAHRTQ